MDNLPTIHDVIDFLKHSWKTILVTMGLILAVFAGLYWYTTQSNEDLEMMEEVATSGEALEGITLKEYQALEEDAVSFSFYAENVDDTAFTNYNLLKTVLLSEEVFPAFTDGLELSYEVPDVYILNISKDVTNALHLTIGTGDYSDNVKLAERIYAAFENNELAFFDDKAIYLLSEPRMVQPEEEIGTTESSATPPSTTNFVILGILGIGLSFVVGLMIAFFQSYRNKSFTTIGVYQFKEADKVINLSRLKGKENKPESLLHTIVHPANGRKLVLTQSSLSPIADELAENNIVVADQITDAAPEEVFHEIVLLVEKNVTEKKWYHDQVLLLKNYDAPVKIVLL